MLPAAWYLDNVDAAAGVLAEAEDSVAVGVAVDHAERFAAVVAVGGAKSWVGGFVEAEWQDCIDGGGGVGSQ